MTDKNDKKLVAKPTMKIVKKQIDIPQQPGDVVKDGLTALAPISVFKVKTPTEVEESKVLIQAEIAKRPELTTLLQWPVQKMAEAFDEFYATRNYTRHSGVRADGDSGMEFFREIITHLNTADDYGSSWHDTDHTVALTMNLRAAIKIHKVTPVEDRYSMRADVSSLRESIEMHRVINAALVQYAEISEGFRTNLRDVGYVPLNSTKSYTGESFKSISNMYTEKSILATYSNLPFFIKKCTDKRSGRFPGNMETEIGHSSGHYQAERIASELLGSWKFYSNDDQPTDVRDLPHFKLAYELQRAIAKDSKVQDSLVEDVISQFLRAGEGVEVAGLVMAVDHPLVSYSYGMAGSWGITSDFERTIPRIGKALYSFGNITQQVRGKAMTEVDIPRDVLIAEIVNYFKYVQALYRALFTNHDANKRGGFYYTRFHDSHYVGVSTRTKENSKVIVGTKRSNADDLLKVLCEDASRMFGRDYIAQPHVDTPHLLEWASFLVHASRYTDNDRGIYSSPRLSGLAVQCSAFRSTIESIRSTTKTFNDLINDLIIERSFKPYAMLAAASELHEKIKAACSSIFNANNALIMRLSLSGYLATDWTDEGSGYSSTVTRLGGRDPDPIEAFGNREATYHKLIDGSTLADISGKTAEAIKDMISNVNKTIEAPKEEAKPEDKPEDKAAE